MQNPIKYLSLFFLLFFYSCLPSACSKKTRDRSWAVKMPNSPMHNFYKVNDSIYRSEQPTEKGFVFLQSQGIKTILNLREDRSDTGIQQKRIFTNFEVPMITADFTEKEIIAALQILKKAPKPILVHCKHGADRTGVVLAMYRIVFENWPKQKAIDELRNGNYGFHRRYRNIIEFIQRSDPDKIKQQVLVQ
jgi:protein tyrosine/serine phosphatase